MRRPWVFGFLAVSALGCAGQVLSPDGGLPFDDGGLYGLDERPANPTCVAPARPVLQTGVSLEPAFPNLTFNQPLLLLQPPSQGNRVWVVEREGTIQGFAKSDAVQPGDVDEVVNITGRIDTNGEGGLLGVAFHPSWPSVLEAFISYTETGTGSNPLRSVIARYRSSDGQTLDPASEERLLLLDQPFTNHNGGNLAFGPDGFLYIGFGDGGSGGDPLGSGQRTNTLLGKILRIDVNVPAAQKYAIPPTNPYAATGQACNLTSNAATNNSVARCAEIYALGVRNPWRWSFDTATGDLWVADVGQDTYEEVDRVVLGGNYGWNTREGAHCYGGGNSCSRAGLIDPVVEYDHSLGSSITGGYVYRGTAIPGLVGQFVVGDYGSGRIWSVGNDPSSGAYMLVPLADTNLAIASFGQTLDGEVYVLGIADGSVHRLIPSGPIAPSSFPALLSQTGCFQPFDPRAPVAALIPYGVNASLWSDGATKDRGFALPDGTSIALEADGDWTLPPGSVVAKTFWLGGKRVETRLFMRHPDGIWAGYSYEWNDAQTDAALLPAGKTKQLAGQSWSFPSRAQCLTCHTSVAGRTLGLENAQLNGLFLYPTGRARNQLETLSALGFFSSPLPAAATLPRLERPEGSGPLEDRARAYLHANCSICHRSGAGQGPADFRFSLPLAQTQTCNVAPQNGDLGVGSSARLVAPGAPDHSIVSLRTHALNAYRMPPLATTKVDAAGTALLDSWISSLTGCPP